MSSIRTQARQYALQKLYSLDTSLTQESNSVVQEFFVPSDDYEVKAIDYAEQLVKQTRAALTQIDKTIEASSEHWRISRMTGIDRNILRLATYELLDGKVPVAVVIHEAINLAKRFGTQDSFSFINGVLDHIAKNPKANPTQTADIEFLSINIDDWEAVSVDTLVFSVCYDERPLCGAAGLADWRMNGKLSHMLKQNKISGNNDDVLMCLPGKQLRFKRLFLFGIGLSKDFNEDVFIEKSTHIKQVLKSVDVSSYAIQVPGRSMDLITPQRAIELWVSQKKPDDHNIFWVDSNTVRKETFAAIKQYEH